VEYLVRTAHNKEIVGRDEAERTRPSRQGLRNVGPHIQWRVEAGWAAGRHA
jgi:hypothetical protein